MFGLLQFGHKPRVHAESIVGHRLLSIRHLDYTLVLSSVRFLSVIFRFRIWRYTATLDEE
jgi:hypothetical protein